MSKFWMAVVATGLGLGLNGAIVSSADAAAAPRSWSDFKVMVKKCDQLTGAEKKQCMADARDTYRASNYNCERMSQPDRTQCLKYHDQWASAASDTNPAVTHTDEPTMTPATPGDPTPAERNRDSTKQQEDAAGTLEQKQNPQNQ